MTTQPCDACGERVRIGGGIGDLWSFERGSSQGMTLELADGSEFFLCFDCIDRLPDDREVTREDVEALADERGAAGADPGSSAGDGSDPE